MQFIRDVFAVSLGVFLGFVAIVNTHGMLDIVYAFSQLGCEDFCIPSQVWPVLMLMHPHRNHRSI